MTIAAIEGIAPGDPRATLNITDVNRELYRQWCREQGCPSSWSLTAKDYQLSAAYRQPNYLAKIQALGAALASRRGRYTPTIDLDELGDETRDIDRLATTDAAKLESPNLFNEPLPQPTPNAIDEVSSSDDKFETTLAAIAKAADQVITGKLASLRQQISTDVAAAARAEMERVGLSDRVKQQIRALAQESAEAVLRDHLPTRVEITSPTIGLTKDIGLQHFKFPQLLRLVNTKGMSGHGLNIWLTGPTGSGKTFSAEGVANALADAGAFATYVRDESGHWTIPSASLNGLIFDSPFGADSSLDADYKVTGYDKADGSFRWTTFLRIFCYGGVYVMDEIDNWNPSALVAANAALANGWVSTPAGIFRRHPDCRIIAAANTWGLGATSDYVGRTKLDAATTDRFPNKLDWPYDERLERALAQQFGGAIGLAWFEIVSRVRREAKTQGLQVIFSPRKTYDGTAVLLAGEPVADVIEMNLKAGLKPEHIEALGLNRLTLPEALRPQLTEVA